jgi:hypothetical protein
LLFGPALPPGQTFAYDSVINGDDLIGPPLAERHGRAPAPNGKSAP